MKRREMTELRTAYHVAIHVTPPAAVWRTVEATSNVLDKEHGCGEAKGIATKGARTLLGALLASLLSLL